MQDDGSAMVTWTGATPLPNHMGLDLGLIIFVRPWHSARAVRAV